MSVLIERIEAYVRRASEGGFTGQITPAEARAILDEIADLRRRLAEAEKERDGWRHKYEASDRARRNTQDALEQTEDDLFAASPAPPAAGDGPPLPIPLDERSLAEWVVAHRPDMAVEQLIRSQARLGEILELRAGRSRAASPPAAGELRSLPDDALAASAVRRAHEVEDEADGEDDPGGVGEMTAALLRSCAAHLQEMAARLLERRAAGDARALAERIALAVGASFGFERDDFPDAEAIRGRYHELADRPGMSYAQARNLARVEWVESVLREHAAPPATGDARALAGRLREYARHADQAYGMGEAALLCRKAADMLEHAAPTATSREPDEAEVERGARAAWGAYQAGWAQAGGWQIVPSWEDAHIETRRLFGSIASAVLLSASPPPPAATEAGATDTTRTTISE